LFSLKKWDAYRLYLVMSGATSFFFALIFTVNMIYQATTVGLNPLQLVLVGTLLEIVCFTFEIPTGVVADVYSRRLSVIIGFFLIGIGFMIEGLFPVFGAVLLAQVAWGIGATFHSGALDAWLVDEVGDSRAAQAFLRASQVGQIAGIIGVIASVGLATLNIQLPIVLSGVLFISMGVWLILVMPEQGFQPAPRTDRETWGSLFKTFGEGVAQVKGSAILLLILAISAVSGMFSEGFDRLWTAHVLENITLPNIGNFEPVIWFGFINISGAVVALVSMEVIRRRVNTENSAAVSRALTLIYALLILALVGFAIAQSFPQALIALWLIGVLRNAIHPLENAWTNMFVESQVRATVLSMRAQLNAFGQIAGGPIVGYIGTMSSLRVALSFSALLLAPTLPLFIRSRQKSPQA
jgi:DHA3 family tetracycline resistance protein-like MFS transporter